jgi:hypothetical protein
MKLLTTSTTKVREQREESRRWVREKRKKYAD